MYVGIEFFIGLFIGVYLYFRTYESVLLLLKRIFHDQIISHKREQAMDRLIEMDEYLQKTRLYK